MPTLQLGAAPLVSPPPSPPPPPPTRLGAHLLCRRDVPGGADELAKIIPPAYSSNWEERVTTSTGRGGYFPYPPILTHACDARQCSRYVCRAYDHMHTITCIRSHAYDHMHRALAGHRKGVLTLAKVYEKALLMMVASDSL